MFVKSVNIRVQLPVFSYYLYSLWDNYINNSVLHICINEHLSPLKV